MNGLQAIASSLEAINAVTTKITKHTKKKSLIMLVAASTWAAANKESSS